MPKLSVIMPVYNVSAYVEQATDSVLSQTYQDLELVTVDDGSTDDSGLICDQIAKRDPRVRVIHQKNGGLSAARNAGLAVARGEWIGFVDSDDYILPEMYEVLFAAAEKTGADVIRCGIVRIPREKVPSSDPYRLEALLAAGAAPTPMPLTYQLYDSKTRMQQYLKVIPAANTSVDDTLWRRSLIGSTQFNVGKFLEDKLFWVDMIAKPMILTDVPGSFYVYCRRPGSIITSDENTEQIRDSNMQSFIKAFNICRSWEENDLAMRAYELVYIDCSARRMLLSDARTTEEKEHLHSFLRDHREEYLRGSHRLLNKVGVILLTTSPRLFYALAELKGRLFDKS